MLSLKSTLLINGVSSWLTGFALIVFANKAAEIFATYPVWPFMGTGAFFVIFGTLVLYTVLQKQIKPALLKTIIVLDLVWVIVSVGITAVTWGCISVAGSVIIIVVALWVFLMALLQNNGLKLLRMPKAGIIIAAVVFSFSITSGHAQHTQLPEVNDEQTIKVATSFLEAVQQKNAAGVSAVMDSLIVWDQPGNNRFSGIKNNAKEVFAMFSGMLKITDRTLELTEKKILAQNGNEVVCQLQWKASQAGGAFLYVCNIDVYTIKNGKISKAVIYSADNKQEDVFWGK